MYGTITFTPLSDENSTTITLTVSRAKFHKHLQKMLKTHKVTPQLTFGQVVIEEPSQQS